MKKLLVSIDDELSKVLDKFPNKSAFIRQAVVEKLKRDQSSETNESAKEFMGLVNKLNKVLDKNQETIEDLKTQAMHHDAKMLIGYNKMEKQFYEIMRVLYRNNIFAVQMVGKDWINENREAIDASIDTLLGQLVERMGNRS